MITLTGLGWLVIGVANVLLGVNVPIPVSSVLYTPGNSTSTQALIGSQTPKTGQGATQASSTVVTVSMNLDYPGVNFTSRLISLTNRDRVSNGLGALNYDPQLAQAAKAKLADMVDSGYFNHVSPSNRSYTYWITSSGYKWIYAGENLSEAYYTPESVETAFMNSPEHKANILGSHYTGVGIAEGYGVCGDANTCGGALNQVVLFVVEEYGSKD